MYVCVCGLTFTPATRTPSADLTTFLKKSSNFSFLFFPRTLSCHHNNMSHDIKKLPQHDHMTPRVCRNGSCVTWTHILVVLQKNVEIEVFPEDWVGSDAAQKDLVHGDGFLEDGQILSETERKASQGTAQGQMRQKWGAGTHASSSCFILVNSSFVMEPSPSPSFCSFSLDASKSGLGGAGGI